MQQRIRRARLTTLVALGAALTLIAAGCSGSGANPSASASLAASEKPCIASGDEMAINSQLIGAGDEAVLCPSAIFALTAPVVFTGRGQRVYTQGNPTDDTRATLIVKSDAITNAVSLLDVSDAQLTNVIVDGNREELGYKEGDALVLAGGTASGQVVADTVVRNTRSWSSMHIFEGNGCGNATIERNIIGPAGTSKEWADGISLACTDSIVRDNTIFDATDGAIVVFQARGSIIEGNTIRAETRTLLGGINMVDYAPYSGDYTGTIVRNNTIEASGAVIRIGLGMGQRIWGCLPAGDKSQTVRGATVTGNVLKGTKMQYGFVVSGVEDWTVTDNRDESKHVGTPSNPCGTTVASKPGGFLIDTRYSKGTFQPEFKGAKLDLALWAIVKPKPGQ